MKRHRLTFSEELGMNETQFNIMRHVERLDHVSADYEARWGCDRLPNIVGLELREKWDSQWQKLDDAIKAQDISMVETLAAGCIRAWAALEAGAIAGGHSPIAPDAWEARHPESGQVYRITRNVPQARIPAAQGVVTYTLEEVVRILESQQLVNVVKQTFPGAEIKNIEFDEF